MDDKSDENRLCFLRLLLILPFMAPQFTKDHVFILPHAEQYRRLYDIAIDQLLQTLNSPDLSEGLADGRYTNEKDFPTHRVYVYYYLTLPLQGGKDEAYAIIDFIGYSAEENALILEAQHSTIGQDGHETNEATHEKHQR